MYIIRSNKSLFNISYIKCNIIIPRRCFSNKSNNYGVYGHDKPENIWDDASYRSLKYEPTLTGSPIMTVFNMTRPGSQPFLDDTLDVMPRNFYGIPATIPPEVGSTIEHTYRLPPQFYPFLKKLGDDTPSLKPYMEKLIRGQFTYTDYEEMFYKFSKPLKIYRKLIAMPFRTAQEKLSEDLVTWENAWYSYRQQVAAEYNVVISLREYILGMLIGIYFAYLWKEMTWQYRADMRLFYSDAPEHKINWVKPRGDL